jgi:cell wall-associated protease
MKDWKKRIATISLSCSLIAGTVFTPLDAVAIQTSTKDYGTAAFGMNQPWDKQKIDNTRQSPLSEDTLIIHYRAPLSPSDHKRMGATLLNHISELNYAVVKIENKKQLQKVISNYKSLTKVISVSQSVIYQSYGMVDPKVGEQYHIQQLQIEKAQKLAPNKKIKVAVIDTGIDMKHPELRGQLLPSYNTVNPMNPGFPDAHGTHVAGIIAGKKDNGIGGYGVNPNATIIPIDVFNRGGGATDFAIAQGIVKAIKSGAKVINMSLGGPYPSPVIEEAVKKAIANKIVVIASAGNSGDDWTNYPAGYEGVISVGNINSRNTLAETSSYGPSVDLVAPGEEIYSSIYEAEKLSSFRKASGTSMSAPVVAGVASLLLTKYPSLIPTQVEYILEHTAKDLGLTGFDVKYGNGLVDPVKALQFDLKKLPNFTSKTLTLDEIIKNAKSINLGYSKSIKELGTITKPYEEKWIKFNVQKGEYVQAVLDGTEQYDYKMTMLFHSKDNQYMESINEVPAGKAEGKLVKAPFTGTLAIGVKDINGSYDDSRNKQSQYSLEVGKFIELSEDESSLESPLEVDALPYESQEHVLTFTGDDGDEDYLKFSVEEQQVIKIETSPVPGVNSSIDVYMAFTSIFSDEGNMEREEDEMPEVQLAPVYNANANGISEGETLTFVADPDIQYYAKFSNKQIGSLNGRGNLPMGEFGEPKTDSSMVPYAVFIDGKTLPIDEDNYPIENLDSNEEDLELIEDEFDHNSSDSKAPTDPVIEDNFTRIQEVSNPHLIKEVTKGYLQYMGDEDWYKVTPSSTGIYEFSFLNSIENPVMEVYQLVTDIDAKGNENSFLNAIGSNIRYGWSTVEIGKKLYTGLKAKETYYIKLNANWISNKLSFEPYLFTSKLLVNNPQDRYEDNNELENVKNLPGFTFEGNFAIPNDQDVFYMQSSSEQVYGVKMERGKVTSQFNKYPYEITRPLNGIVVIYEDTNKNRKVDGNESLKVQLIDRGATSGNTYGSFKVEKGKSYIIVLSSNPESNIPFTLMPYQMTIAALKQKDEDIGNKVVKNKPTKPIPLNKKNSTLWESAGYLNSGNGYGDHDWYTFTLDQNRSGMIKLETSNEVDGKIELYQNGKLISSADFYPEGDAEVLAISLKKGTYQIKIKDYFGNTTLTPYKLKVYMK